MLLVLLDETFKEYVTLVCYLNRILICLVIPHKKLYLSEILREVQEWRSSVIKIRLYCLTTPSETLNLNAMCLKVAKTTLLC